MLMCRMIQPLTVCLSEQLFKNAIPTAICQMAEKYDIYYRTHIQTYGWTDWAKNGQSCGSEGLAKRLEGIEIRLVPKGLAAPGATSRIFWK